MTVIVRVPRRSRAVALCFAFLTAVSQGAGADDGGGATAHDVRRKLVGPMRCGECHQLEFAAWKQSRHQTGYLAMHRTPAAKEIAKKLGIKRIKRDASCISCHYSASPTAPKLKPASGVSCESCHGAAADWDEIHATYGGPEATAATETAEHEKARHEQSLAAGMKAPFAIDRLARRCYECHVIASPELVEVGGHPAGNADFDLVAWLEGEVRHNYFFSPDKNNREASPERKRLLHVVGQGLALESGLRGWSKAEASGIYLEAMVAQVVAAEAGLRAVAAKVDIAEVAEMLAAIEPIAPIEARVDHGEQLWLAAGRVAAAVHGLSARSDGSKLDALDQLLPSSSRYRGSALP